MLNQINKLLDYPNYNNIFNMDFVGPCVENAKAARTKLAIGNVTRNVDCSVVKSMELKGGFPSTKDSHKYLIQLGNTRISF